LRGRGYANLGRYIERIAAQALEVKDGTRAREQEHNYLVYTVIHFDDSDDELSYSLVEKYDGRDG